MSFFLRRLRRSASITVELSAGDLYFIANTSNQPHNVAATFRPSARYAEWWDAFTGQISLIENPAKIEISLQPYESRLIYLTNSASTTKPGALA